MNELIEYLSVMPMKEFIAICLGVLFVLVILFK